MKQRDAKVLVSQVKVQCWKIYKSYTLHNLNYTIYLV